MMIRLSITLHMIFVTQLIVLSVQNEGTLNQPQVRCSQKHKHKQNTLWNDDYGLLTVFHCVLNYE